MTTFACRAFFNETSRFDPYTPGDTLTCSARGFMDIERDGTLAPIAAANEVYRRMNVEDRSGTDWAHERSLSVGDVISVEWADADTGTIRQARYAVEPFGFREV